MRMNIFTKFLANKEKNNAIKGETVERGFE